MRQALAEAAGTAPRARFGNFARAGADRPQRFASRLAPALAAAAVILTQASALRAEAPLSAIDWLSDSVQSPPAAGLPPVIDEPPVSSSVLPEDVTVMPLGVVSPDAAGLRPAAALGLPKKLWGPTSAADLGRAVRQMRADMLPAPQGLLLHVLLAELDPPFDSDIRGVMLLARVDKLLDIGALDQAAALLDLTGITQSTEIFRRAFDVALLTGDEDRLCRTMDSAPSLSPTYPARIFCQARNGDWETAALTYGTARALGFLDASQEVLLGRFLDPHLFEDEEMPPRTGPMTPLDFRLLEAIGEPPATASLPRAFAQLDLRQIAGWKAQIEAAERLARVGAISADQLFALYTERRPAASGGVWDRAAAVQSLDAALSAGDIDKIAELLPQAWSKLASAELEPCFADMFARRLAEFKLTGTAGATAYRAALLTPDFEAAARAYGAGSGIETVLHGVALGEVPPPTGRDALILAISEGFAAKGAPSRVASLIANQRTGEALLRAIDLVAAGANGNLDELTDGLATLRALGFETSARRAALELLILDRRG